MKKLLMVLILSLTGILTTKADPYFRDFVSELNSLPQNERNAAVQEFITEHPVTPLYENDTTVHLYWYGTAKTVLIAGDLQAGWSKPEKLEVIKCGDSSFFYISYNIPSNCRLDYQFIIDEKYITDPGNPVITPSGFGPHSEISMPGFEHNPILQARDEVAKGTIDTMTFVSNNKSVGSRKIKIYVPPVKSEDMPVYLVYDGIEALDFMMYPVVLDNLIADKKIQPIVVVFIPPVDRFEESMGEKSVAFINSLCDDLIPVIEKKYETSAKASKRGITGISAGGTLALSSIFLRPDKILCSAGQSSSITRELKGEFKSVNEKDRSGMKVYMDVGRYDLRGGPFEEPFVESNTKFSCEIESSGIKVRFNQVNDGHSWANWRERTPEILIWFFGE